MKPFFFCALVFFLAVPDSGRGQSLDWAKQAGGSGFDGAEAIGVDDAGNSYAVGNVVTEATFGAGEPNETTLFSAGNVTSQDIFVVKYDATGTLLWARGIGGTDPNSGGNAGTDRGWALAVD
jgi:hypothetical protein